MSPDDTNPPKDREPSLLHASVLPLSLGDTLPRRKRASPGVGIEVLRAYLERPDTQRHLRSVVARTLGRKATRPLVDDLANESQAVAMASETLAESEERLPAWLEGVARDAVGRWRSEQRAEFGYIEGVRAFKGAAHLAVPTDEDAKGFLLSGWLRAQVKESPADRELVELLAYKAKSKKSYDEIAAEQGTTAASIYNRIYRLKAKYVPRYREEKRNRSRVFFLILRGVAVAAFTAAVGLILWWLMHRRVEAKPTDDLPIMLPLPPAPVMNEPFNQAAPRETPTAAPPEEPVPHPKAPTGPQQPARPQR